MFRLFVTASFLLVVTNAAAKENTFNADMDNPTISAVISEFEQVCFPFISHETELTPEQNREVFQSRMVEAGYEFDVAGAEASMGVWKVVGHSYASTSSSIFNNIGPYFPATITYCPHLKYPSPQNKGKYLIFPHPEIREDVEQSCEILTIYAHPPVIRSQNIKEFYTKVSEKPIVATLSWQDFPDFKEKIIKQVDWLKYSRGFKVRTSFPPASSCVIHADDAGLTADIVESAIVQRDPDWKIQDVLESDSKEPIPDAHAWSQCTKQDEENYVYKANLIDGSFSLSVKVLQDDENASEYGCEAPEE